MFEQISPNPIVYQRYDGETGVWYTADFSGDGDGTAIGGRSTSPSRPRRRAPRAPAASPRTSARGRRQDRAAPARHVRLRPEGRERQGGRAPSVVLFNEGTIGAADRNDVLIPTLAGYDATIPVVGTDYATGRALVDLAAPPARRHAAREGRRLHQRGRPDQQRHRRDAGRPRRPHGGRRRAPGLGVRGPGINDDGSGVGMMLETAEQMADSGSSPATRSASSSSAARSRACSAPSTTSRS